MDSRQLLLAIAVRALYWDLNQQDFILLYTHLASCRYWASVLRSALPLKASQPPLPVTFH